MTGLQVTLADKRAQGTPFDRSGHSAERSRERQLNAKYEAKVDELVEGPRPERHAPAGLRAGQSRAAC
jgi:hypothetical protein